MRAEELSTSLRSSPAGPAIGLPMSQFPLISRMYFRMGRFGPRTVTRSHTP